MHISTLDQKPQQKTTDKLREISILGEAGFEISNTESLNPFLMRMDNCKSGLLSCKVIFEPLMLLLTDRFTDADKLVLAAKGVQFWILLVSGSVH